MHGHTRTGSGGVQGGAGKYLCALHMPSCGSILVIKQVTMAWGLSAPNSHPAIITFTHSQSGWWGIRGGVFDGWGCLCERGGWEQSTGARRYMKCVNMCVKWIEMGVKVHLFGTDEYTPPCVCACVCVWMCISVFSNGFLSWCVCVACVRDAFYSSIFLNVCEFVRMQHVCVRVCICVSVVIRMTPSCSLSCSPRGSVELHQFQMKINERQWPLLPGSHFNEQKEQRGRGEKEDRGRGGWGEGGGEKLESEGEIGRSWRLRGRERRMGKRWG